MDPSGTFYDFSGALLERKRIPFLLYPREPFENLPPRLGNRLTLAVLSDGHVGAVFFRLFPVGTDARIRNSTDSVLRKNKLKTAA